MNASTHHLLWFGISGLIGFTIGDTFLFRGYVLIGPRLTMLLMSLSPIFGTILAWIFLSESLNLLEFFGIIITISGISIVLYHKEGVNKRGKDFLAGIFYGFGASLCQALGYFASKKGLLHNDFSALSGNLIRIMSGALFIWIIAVFQKQAFSTIPKLANKKAVLVMLCGAFFGPFIGVWLSLIAIQHTYIGIASTLMALPPLILIPLSHWIFKERITHISVVGTLIAMIGVSLIFLR
jgi:drug/metabolite transporter (DMT)-like permease